MSTLLFYADEHLRQHSVRKLLAPHRVEFLALQTRDPAIVMAAEQSGAIILTSDTWFHTELRQGPYHTEKRRKKLKGAADYSRAGVFLVAGEWAVASQQIKTWLPLIETTALIHSATPGKRVVVCIGDKNTLQVDL